MASTSIDMPAAAAKAANRRLELLRSAPLNSWIALSADETQILAIAKTFMEADEIAQKTGQKDYFLTRTPDEWVSRVFTQVS
jgi:hypothetical protein